MASEEILLLSLVSVASALAALEVERISRAIVALAIWSGAIGFIFLHVGANYAAVYMLLLYGGVLIVLFMVAASFAEHEKPQSKKEAGS
ncbi:MAG: hypothetical protein ACXACI_17940 [Candidatus Hodarchaeales archaeon]|jgi:NADH:ubiquinone oxidoreductase subunit 6 (subunit J)